MKLFLFFMFITLVHAIRYKILIDYTVNETTKEITRIYEIELASLRPDLYLLNDIL